MKTFLLPLFLIFFCSIDFVKTAENNDLVEQQKKYAHAQLEYAQAQRELEQDSLNLQLLYHIKFVEEYNLEQKRIQDGIEPEVSKLASIKESIRESIQQILEQWVPKQLAMTPEQLEDLFQKIYQDTNGEFEANFQALKKQMNDLWTNYLLEQVSHNPLQKADTDELTAKKITHRELILETAKRLLQQADILDMAYKQSVLDWYNKNLVGEPMSSENMRILAKTLLQELNNSALIIKNGSPIMLEVKEAQDILNRYIDYERTLYKQLFLKLDMYTAFLVADKLGLDEAFLIPLIKKSIIKDLQSLKDIAETERFDSVLQHVPQEYAMNNETLIALVEKIKTDTDSSNDTKTLNKIKLQTQHLATIYEKANKEYWLLCRKEFLLLTKKQAIQFLENIEKNDRILLQHLPQEYVMKNKELIAQIEKINTDTDTDTDTGNSNDGTFSEILLQTRELKTIYLKALLLAQKELAQALLLVQKELAPKRNLWKIVRTAVFDHKFKAMVPLAVAGAVIIGAAKVLVPAIEAAL
jgi:hypothetical protein